MAMCCAIAPLTLPSLSRYEMPDAEALGMQSSQRISQQFIVGCLVEQIVELLINSHQRSAVLVTGLVQLAHERFHRRELMFCRPLRCESGGKALQHQAQFEYILQVGDADLGHEHASPGSEKDKTFGRESLQALRGWACDLACRSCIRACSSMADRGGSSSVMILCRMS